MEARYRLAECFYYGDEYAQDQVKAFKVFEKLAKRGHHWAQYMLGDCYENGFRLPLSSLVNGGADSLRSCGRKWSGH